MPRILLIEDENDLRDLVSWNLSKDGFETTGAATGEDGLAQAVRAAESGTPYSLILLDWMLPKMSGLEVCRALRAHPKAKATPIVMLTARGEETDIVRGLEAGADDYVTKPFSPKVLIARVQAVLRRTQPADTDAPLRAGKTTLDPACHQVTVDGTTTPLLTGGEFRFLRLLMTRPGRVYTRQQIIDAVHDGFAAVTDRSVDAMAVQLRRKLGADNDLIETVRGVGYRLKA